MTVAETSGEVLSKPVNINCCSLDFAGGMATMLGMNVAAGFVKIVLCTCLIPHDARNDVLSTRLLREAAEALQRPPFCW